MALNLGFIGFGEAGLAMASGLKSVDEVAISCYDIAHDRRRCAEHIAVLVRNNPRELAESAQILFSTVTADQSIVAAGAIAPYLGPDHLFLDCNSVSPGTKREADALIRAASARYLDVAVMAPVHPLLHRTPLLVAGPDQEARLLDRLGLDYRWVADSIGSASVIKMLRSILIKGTESILTECVTAAEMLGITDEILVSAGKTLGIADLPSLADYMMERVALHGARRAAEMREVAKTLNELGLSGFMAAATAVHQQMVADMRLPDRMQVRRDRAVLARAIRWRHPEQL